MKANVAVLQYKVQPNVGWMEAKKLLEGSISQAHQVQADFLVLPEYVGLEVFTHQSLATRAHFQKIHDMNQNYCEFFSGMAKQYHIYLQPGTIPFAQDNKFYNRAYFFSPEGDIYYQDKIRLTQFEKDLNILRAGKEIQIIPTRFGKVAIAICYDVEFPDYVSVLAKNEVGLLLVPSCTENLQGFYRVHLSCRARALENQFFVANACLVGGCSSSEVIDVATGQSGIFSPIDLDFPEDGILALTHFGEAQLTHAEIDFTKIPLCRQEGKVTNFYDHQINISAISIK